MKTAAGYRAMAEECLLWASQAKTREASASLQQLAQIWLDTASRFDGRPAIPDGSSKRASQNYKIDRLNGHGCSNDAVTHRLSRGDEARARKARASARTAGLLRYGHRSYLDGVILRDGAPDRGEYRQAAGVRNGHHRHFIEIAPLQTRA